MRGRISRRRCLGRINELLNFCSFLVNFGHVLCALLLVNVEFCLGAILLADMNIVLSEAVMGIRKVGFTSSALVYSGMDFANSC